MSCFPLTTFQKPWAVLVRTLNQDNTTATLRYQHRKIMLKDKFKNISNLTQAVLRMTVALSSGKILKHS